MSIFVKWDCGCIGFQPGARKHKTFVVRPCDGDRDDTEYRLGWRNMSEKSFEDLEDNTVKSEAILLNLAGLIDRGNRYDEIRRLLRME